MDSPDAGDLQLVADLNFQPGWQVVILKEEMKDQKNIFSLINSFFSLRLLLGTFSFVEGSQ